MAEIEINKEKIAAFCERYHVQSFALFGSVLRDDFGVDSDIDVLVEFESGFTPGLFTIARMERELSHLFAGRKIDLRTPEDLSPYFRQNVLQEARVEYAA
jgi:predicted nucleotidyltransferase